MHSQMQSDADVKLDDTGPDSKPPTEPWLRAVYNAELDVVLILNDQPSERVGP